MWRFFESSAPPVLEALTNGILQGMLLVALVWVVVGLARRLNATTRYTIWLSALIVIVGLPVIAPHIARLGADGYRLLASHPEFASLATDAPMAAVGIGDVPKPTLAPVPGPTAGFPTYTRSPWEKGTAMASSALERVGVSLPLTVSPGWGALLVFGVILFGSILLFARLVGSSCHLRRLKSSALPLPSPLRERIDHLMEGRRTIRRIRVRHAAGLTMPTACGFLHPVIVFPSHLLGKLTASEIEHIVRHELAHLRRWDDWTNLLQRMLEAVFFFHPAVRIIGRQLSLQREIACDDWVISQSNGVRSYAICLTRLVSLTAWSPPQPLAALGALRTKSQFSRRIEALLNRKRNALPRLSKAALVSVMVLLALTIGQLGQMPALLAFEESVDELQSDVFYASLSTVPAPDPLVITGPDIAHGRLNVAHPGIVAPGLEHIRVTPVAVTRTDAPQVERIPVVAELTVPVTGDRGAWTRLISAVSFSPPQVSGNGMNGIASPHQEHISLDELVGLLQVGVSGEYIRKLRQLGVSDLGVSELFDLRGDGITLDYLSAIRDAGFRHLSIDDIRTLRSAGADADYLEAIAQTGLEHLSIDELITLRSSGVTPGFVKAARSHGPRDITADEIAYLRRYGVSGDYLRALKETGVTPLSVEDIVALRLHGVTAAFVSALKKYNSDSLTRDDILALQLGGVSRHHAEHLQKAGVDELRPDELLELRRRGVTGDYAGTVLSYGFESVDSEGICALRAAGVSSAYLKDLRGAGQRWSVEDIIRLHCLGITADAIGATVKADLEKLTVDELIRRGPVRPAGISLQ